MRTPYLDGLKPVSPAWEPHLNILERVWCCCLWMYIIIRGQCRGIQLLISHLCSFWISAWSTESTVQGDEGESGLELGSLRDSSGDPGYGGEEKQGLEVRLEDNEGLIEGERLTPYSHFLFRSTTCQKMSSEEVIDWLYDKKIIIIYIYIYIYIDTILPKVLSHPF